MSMVTLSFFNEKSIDYCNLSLVFQLPVYPDPAGYQHPGKQDWQILHTAATFLAYGERRNPFPTPRTQHHPQDILRAPLLKKKAFAKDRHRNYRNNFRSFPTNLLKSRGITRFYVDVRIEANVDSVAASTHQISCWTVLRNLVDKTNRIYIGGSFAGRPCIKTWGKSQEPFKIL